MTNEEAICVLKNAAWLGSDKDRKATEEAVNMAIEALQQVTGKLNNRDDSLLTEDSDACKESKSKLDLISIQMAIEHWGRSSGNLTNNQIAELQREIESLPSEEPKTEWIPVSEALPSKGQVVLDIDDKETWGDKGTWDVDKQRGW